MSGYHLAEFLMPLGQVMFDTYPIPDDCLIRAALFEDTVLLLHEKHYVAVIDIQTSRMFALQSAYVQD